MLSHAMNYCQSAEHEESFLGWEAPGSIMGIEEGPRRVPWTFMSTVCLFMPTTRDTAENALDEPFQLARRRHILYRPLRLLISTGARPVAR